MSTLLDPLPDPFSRATCCDHRPHCKLVSPRRQQTVHQDPHPATCKGRLSMCQRRCTRKTTKSEPLNGDWYRSRRCLWQIVTRWPRSARSLAPAKRRASRRPSTPRKPPRNGACFHTSRRQKVRLELTKPALARCSRRQLRSEAGRPLGIRSRSSPRCSHERLHCGGF